MNGGERKKNNDAKKKNYSKKIILYFIAGSYGARARRFDERIFANVARIARQFVDVVMACLLFLCCSVLVFFCWLDSLIVILLLLFFSFQQLTSMPESQREWLLWCAHAAASIGTSQHKTLWTQKCVKTTTKLFCFSVWMLLLLFLGWCSSTHRTSRRSVRTAASHRCAVDIKVARRNSFDERRADAATGAVDGGRA